MKKSDASFLKNVDGAYIDKRASVGEGVIIYPNSYILGETIIGNNTIIYPNTTIENSVIGSDCEIKSSYIEDSNVGDEVIIGPYAHLRPNSNIGNKCKIGNFVEIKNATLKEGTKASHLAYVGDVDVGENCNIGCGAIFVNYNGKSKNRSVIGDNVFIGSNCNVIAPLNIASNSYICAGTTITVDTKNDDFVIGRAREIVKNNRAHKYLKEMR